jgi:CRISPR/Cas system-associated protein Csm6
MKIKYTPLVIAATIAGALAAFFFNFYFLTNIIIPDPCYYHSRDTALLFDLFYTISSADGDHPSPSAFNIIFTIIAGAAAGRKICLYILQQNRKKHA